MDKLKLMEVILYLSFQKEESTFLTCKQEPNQIISKTNFTPKGTLVLKAFDLFLPYKQL